MVSYLPVSLAPVLWSRSSAYRPAGYRTLVRPGETIPYVSIGPTENRRARSVFCSRSLRAYVRKGRRDGRAPPGASFGIASGTARKELRRAAGIRTKPASLLFLPCFPSRSQRCDEWRHLGRATKKAGDPLLFETRVFFSSPSFLRGFLSLTRVAQPADNRRAFRPRKQRQFAARLKGMAT